MERNPYQQLAEKLDSLPNGFPATDDGRELKLLAKIFTPDDAELAAQLTPSLETAEEISARTGREPAELRKQLKQMSRDGLVEPGRKDGALAFKLMPFVVGIYEMQLNRMDAELAQLFEDYFQRSAACPDVKEKVEPVQKVIRYHPINLYVAELVQRLAVG